MRRIQVALCALALLGGGCNKYKKVLLTSSFKEVCPGGDPEEAWIRFERDGTFDWAYAERGPWQDGNDGRPERWSLKKTTLVVSWNDAYAVTVYRLGEVRNKRAPGTSTVSACVDSGWLEHVGARPTSR